jgi:acetate---CoA ligase (ADP-forming)
VPLTEARARAMIAKTSAGRLVGGYRGAPGADIDSLAQALVGLSRLAEDLGERLESVDLNPVLAVPGQTGTLALDALVVLREGATGVGTANR